MSGAMNILLAMSLVAIGCADKDNPVNSVSMDSRLVGSWADKDGTTYLFGDDGVFVDEFGDRYRWTTDNGKLVIRGGDEYYGTYTYQLTEDTLTLTDPDDDFKVGDPAIFTRAE